MLSIFGVHKCFVLMGEANEISWGFFCLSFQEPDIPHEEFNVPYEKHDIPYEKHNIPYKKHNIPYEKHDIPSITYHLRWLK